MKKIAILTNIIPPYREDFFRRVFNEKELDVTVFCQSYSDRNINVIHDLFPDNVVNIRFMPFLKGKLVIHMLPFIRLYGKYDIIIGDGNPRHIAQALFLSVARIFGKKVAIWSTYDSRRNVQIASKLRLSWWRMFKYILAYTERDTEAFINAGWNKEFVFSLNNGINQVKVSVEREKWIRNKQKFLDWKLENNLNSRRILLSSGRAIEGRYEETLDSIRQLIKVNGSFLWVVIGDGSGLETLRRNIENYNLSNNVLLLGSLYDECQLAPWFMVADLFVYTDAIGLSLMHSFGYGLPVVIHDEILTHGPEASIFTDGETGLFYKKGSQIDFQSKVLELMNDEVKRSEMGKNAMNLVETKYNTSNMASQFLNFVKKVS